MRNYKRSEATEQIALIQWCSFNEFRYPGLKLFFHIPNGGQRNKIEGASLKRQGVKRGVPDLFLPVAKLGYHGLFIEMKYGKNRASKEQKEYIQELLEQSYLCKICYGVEEAINVIEKYLS